MTLSTILLFSILLLSTCIATQKDYGAKCECFKTNTNAYFAYYRFFDYRNIDKSLTSTPSPLQSADDTSNANETSSFFSDSKWTTDWTIQTWNNSDQLKSKDVDATKLMIYSKNNVYIEEANIEDPHYSTHLTMRTLRTTSFQSAAEIDSVSENFHFLSIRFLARIRGDPGACAGIFTWRCPGLCRSPSTPDVEEADIEILTRDPRNVMQLTNQPVESPSGRTKPEATKNVTLSSGSTWESWNEYRYDWTPGLSSWYVNGSLVGEISYQAPKNPAQLILNMWGNGGSWTGNMSVGGSAYLQIQWIEIAYNTSGSEVSSMEKMRRNNEHGSLRHFENSEANGGKTIIEKHEALKRRADSLCRAVCSIDEQNGTKGNPVLISNAEFSRDSLSITLIASMVALTSLVIWL